MVLHLRLRPTIFVWTKLSMHTRSTSGRLSGLASSDVMAWLQEHVVEYLDDMLEPEEALGSKPIGHASDEAAASTQHSGRKREVFAA